MLNRDRKMAVAMCSVDVNIKGWYIKRTDLQTGEWKMEEEKYKECCEQSH